jgi:hypothetical protein
MRDEMQVKSPVLQIDRSAAFIYETNTHSCFSSFLRDTFLVTRENAPSTSSVIEQGTHPTEASVLHISKSLS